MGELTMLTLSSRGVETRNFTSTPSRMVIRVSSQQDRPKALRAREAFLVTKGNLPEGFGVYIALARDAVALAGLPSQTKTIVLPDQLSYLAHGDVLRLWPRKNEIRVLYRRSSF